MKFLLGNSTLHNLGGSEMWTLTLATELTRSGGHHVTAYSPRLGIVADMLEKAGIKCINRITNQPDRGRSSYKEDSNDYDVIICAHYEITKYLKRKLPDVPMITITHGVIHKNPISGQIFPEHPVTEFKVDEYLAVSEEVQGQLLRAYGIKATILRNFFDLERFKFMDNNIQTDKPKCILVNSNYWGDDDPIHRIIKEVAGHYDADLMTIGLNFSPTLEVEKVLEQADIVFGMGRSVLEGVCMGKLGVVHGRWGTGGVITPESYQQLRMTNFSGRHWMGSNHLRQAQEIVSQIDAAWNMKVIRNMRKIIENEHNVNVAAKQLIEIAETIIEKKH